jgi:hypothetical protein
MNKFRLAAISAIYFSGLAASEAGVNLIQNGAFTSLNNGSSSYNGSGFFGPSSIAPGGVVPNTTVTGWTSLGYNYALSSATVLPSGKTGFELWDSANSSGANTWNGVAPTGNFLALDGAYDTGKVYQDVSGLTVGRVYQITFTYAFAQQQAFTGATSQGLQVGLGTALNGGSNPFVWQSLNNSVQSQGFSGWNTVTVNFTASAVKEELSFLANSTPQVPPFALITNVSLTAPGPAPGESLGALALLSGLLLRARAKRRLSS